MRQLSKCRWYLFLQRRCTFALRKEQEGIKSLHVFVHSIRETFITSELSEFAVNASGSLATVFVTIHKYCDFWAYFYVAFLFYRNHGKLYVFQLTDGVAFVHWTKVLGRRFYFLCVKLYVILTFYQIRNRFSELIVHLTREVLRYGPELSS